MNDAALAVSGLSKRFYTGSEELVIFENLSFEVETAKRLAITGESGCGKSTLLNILGGLEAPSSGTVRAGPYEVTTLDENSLTGYRSGYLGLVFQFHYLLKDFTALENVMLPAIMAGVKRKEASERARQLLADVKLDHRLDHLPSRMSGGERQRAAVARSLVNSPSLILADEPTGNLDPDNSALVREILFDVVTRYRKTLILVTHDREIASMADSTWSLTKTGLVTS